MTAADAGSALPEKIKIRVRFRNDKPKDFEFKGTDLLHDLLNAVADYAKMNVSDVLLTQNMPLLKLSAADGEKAFEQLGFAGSCALMCDSLKVKPFEAQPSPPSGSSDEELRAKEADVRRKHMADCALKEVEEMMRRNEVLAHIADDQFERRYTAARSRLPTSYSRSGFTEKEREEKEKHRQMYLAECEAEKRRKKAERDEVLAHIADDEYERRYAADHPRILTSYTRSGFTDKEREEKEKNRMKYVAECEAKKREKQAERDEVLAHIADDENERRYAADHPRILTSYTRSGFTDKEREEKEKHRLKYVAECEAKRREKQAQRDEVLAHIKDDENERRYAATHRRVRANPSLFNDQERSEKEKILAKEVAEGQAEMRAKHNQRIEVREKIAEDNARRRRARAQLPPPQPVVAVVGNNLPAQADYANIQVRLNNNAGCHVASKKFSVNAKFGEVREWIYSEGVKVGAATTNMKSHTGKILTANDNDRTLKQLGLAPSATINVSSSSGQLYSFGRNY